MGKLHLCNGFRNKFGWIVATALALAGVARGATIDQSVTISTLGYGATPGISGSRLGETFTAGLTGKMTQIDLQVARYAGSAGDLVVDITSQNGGKPDSVLATMIIPFSSVQTSVVRPQGENFFPIPLTTPLAVTTGEKLGVVIHVDSGDAKYNWTGFHLGVPADSYTGGLAWAFVGSAWQPMSFGASENLDLGFRTWVDTSATAVPLPASLWSGASVLAGLGILRMRRRESTDR